MDTGKVIKVIYPNDKMSITEVNKINRILTKWIESENIYNATVKIETEKMKIDLYVLNQLECVVLMVPDDQLEDMRITNNQKEDYMNQSSNIKGKGATFTYSMINIVSVVEGIEDIKRILQGHSPKLYWQAY